MKRIGISLYPEIVGEKETIQYIRKAAKAGFRRAFANLLHVEDNEEGRRHIEMQTRVFKIAKDLGFETILDVNPGIYRAFKLKPTETKFFKKLNVQGIRLDEDFGGKVEAELSKNKDGMFVELNASAGTKTMEAALKKGGNPKKLIACYNFYPMRYTGQDFARFIELGTEYKAMGVKTAAFVTLDQKRKGVGPWDVNDGMPTLEIHRDLSLGEQVRQMLEFGFIDDIIISQQGATAEDFKEVKSIIKAYEKMQGKDVVTLRLEEANSINETERKVIYKAMSELPSKEASTYGLPGKEHFDRPDYNSAFIRSTFTRIIYKDSKIKPKYAGRKLKRGDVIVLNENKGRYKGELHIILKDLDDSKEKVRNFVGRIDERDLPMIGMLRQPMRFKFKKGSK